MINYRLLNSKRVQNRPGRRAVYPQFPTPGRVDQVRVSSGHVFDLCFQGDGGLAIRDPTGVVQISRDGGAFPWRTATVDQIVWCLVNVTALDRDIVVCFPGMQPQIFRWNASGAWNLIAFEFPALTYGGLAAPFYRLAGPGITLQPSDITGNITLTASTATFVPGMVGTFIQWLGSQILLTGYTSPTVMSGQVQQLLPFSKDLHTASGNVNGYFSPGDIVQGTLTGYQAEVVQWNAVGQVLTVNMLKSGLLFAGINGSAGSSPEGDTIVGPTGSIVPTNVDPLTLSVISPVAAPSAQWSELIVGAFRGWPQSCFFDQGRLGFTNIPSLPRAVIWCGVSNFYNFLPGAQPTDAILELMAETAQIYHIIPGDGGEFVLTDVGAFYIPINENNPLKPGSVAFRPVTPEAASSVKPVRVAEGVLYVNAGLNRITLVAGSGATGSVKPYSTLDITTYHASLFSNLKAIAVTQGDGTFAERYIYALDAVGNMAVGRFDISKGWVGWTPWNGAGVPNWLSTLQSTLTFTDVYTVSDAPQITIIERLDDSYYLDSGLPVNNVPVGLQAPLGKGPLWWLPGGSVTLMDQGTRPLGTYQIDANGFIIPQFIGGEDLASATLVAGQPWTSTYEPFIPQNASGQTVGQRMKRRKIARWAISALHSSGFIVGDTRISTYRMGDDATLPPPLREETVTGRQQGRDFDPRLIVVKDTPGPFTLIEAGAEVTV